MQCTFGSHSGLDTHKHHGLTAIRDTIAARLRKPEGFRGSPIFADDRQVDPLTDVSCQIRPDKSDPEELTYDLLISDFSRCGVLKRNVSLLLLLVLLLVVFQFLIFPHSVPLFQFHRIQILVFFFLKTQIVYVFTPCILVNSYRRFERIIVYFSHRLPHIYLESLHFSISCSVLLVSSFQYLYFELNKTRAFYSKKIRKNL